MSRSESDAVERLRELLAKAESEGRLAPVFVYWRGHQPRELLALHDEAVRVIFNVAQAPCYSEVPQVDRDAVRAFLAKAADLRRKADIVSAMASRDAHAVSVARALRERADRYERGEHEEGK